MKLYHKDTNKPAEIDDLVVSFRNEAAFINGMREPHKPSSTGRVYVSNIKGGEFAGEYFPGVYNLEWRDE